MTQSKARLVMSGDIDLKVVPGSFQTTMQYNDGRSHNVLVIDLDNNPSIKTGKNGEQRLKLSVYESAQVGKYGDTHHIRVGLTADAAKAVNEQQRNDICKIFGNLAPIHSKGTQNAAPQPYAPAAGPAPVNYGAAPASGVMPGAPMANAPIQQPVDINQYSDLPPGPAAGAASRPYVNRGF